MILCLSLSTSSLSIRRREALNLTASHRKPKNCYWNTIFLGTPVNFAIWSNGRPSFLNQDRFKRSILTCPRVWEKRLLPCRA